MLRGNHESRAMTEHFTFRSEILQKFDQDIYDRFIACFEAMPKWVMTFMSAAIWVMRAWPWKSFEAP